MKVLILGATGMAGHLISLYFSEKGYDVVAFSRRSFSFCHNINGDVTDFDFLKNTIASGSFDVIINCVGILNKNAEENKSLAVCLNSLLPHVIVDWTKKTKTKLIHMSTDCVFSGNTGPYYEDSNPNGISFYDRSKALGEINDNKNLTFRNSIIGPDINSEGIGLFNWFMKQSGTIWGYSSAIWTGVTTLTLAQAMEEAIKVDLTGVYNLVNNKSINKYELLGLFNKYFRNGSIEIKDSNQLQLDKSLRNTRSDFNFKVPSYEQMIEEMKVWIQKHADIYPIYYR